jgi:hypothetical protein
MTTPVTDPDYKELDFEIGRRLPLAKHLKDSRLSILVFRRRTLRAFIPADHVFHLTLSLLQMLMNYSRLSLLLGGGGWAMGT